MGLFLAESNRREKALSPASVTKARQRLKAKMMRFEKKIIFLRKPISK